MSNTRARVRDVDHDVVKWLGFRIAAAAVDLSTYYSCVARQGVRQGVELLFYPLDAFVVHL